MKERSESLGSRGAARTTEEWEQLVKSLKFGYHKELDTLRKQLQFRHVTLDEPDEIRYFDLSEGIPQEYKEVLKTKV